MLLALLLRPRGLLVARVSRVLRRFVFLEKTVIHAMSVT
jgi:hypothetical protein